MCKQRFDVKKVSGIRRVGRRWTLRAGIALCAALLFAAATSAGTAADGESPSFLVAAMRVEPTMWDKEANFQLLEKYARIAAGHGAQLFVTGECFLDGYTGNRKRNPRMSREEYLAVGETIDGPLLTRVARLADELDIYLSVGFAERREEKMHNSVALFSPDGKLVLHYSKTHTKGEPFNTPGTGFPVAETGVGRIGALVCYDRRFPETARILALKGAQLILIPSFGTDGERNEALLRTRAWENSVYVMWVKPNGVLVIDPEGKVIARDEGDHDQLVYARIVLDARINAGDIRYRAPELYGEILDLDAESK